MNSNKSSSRSRKRRAESPPSQTGDTKGTTKSTSTTAYSRNFQQHLIDHGVYSPEYRYPDRRKPSKPSNWTEINERLAQSRASLSLSKFSEDHFEDFQEVDAYASKKKPITTSVIPILDGDVGDAKCVEGDYLFGNLAPLTDGTLAWAKPDHFYGARPEQLDHQIRNKLSDHIIPSMQDDLPMVPNFFLEAKGPDGSLAVATRQACYDGALGARGMHALQSYQQDRSTYDNSAYTLSSTYHGGTLKLYTTHLTEPEGPGRRPEYIMTQLKGWSLTSDLGTFRQGACAYRNGRDWAKEKRDEFIRTANETNSKAQSLLLHSTSHSQTASEAAPTMDDSDVSTLSDDAEHSNAQWSFAATTEGEEEILSRNTKKPRRNHLAGRKRRSHPRTPSGGTRSTRPIPVPQLAVRTEVGEGRPLTEGDEEYEDMEPPSYRYRKQVREDLDNKHTVIGHRTAALRHGVGRRGKGDAGGGIDAPGADPSPLNAPDVADIQISGRSCGSDSDSVVLQINLSKDMPRFPKPVD
ncbi:hypothetical protein RJZ57_005781 [Blastomyces gilchristii]